LTTTTTTSSARPSRWTRTVLLQHAFTFSNERKAKGTMSNVLRAARFAKYTAQVIEVGRWSDGQLRMRS